jgi:hypothetical protein
VTITLPPQQPQPDPRGWLTFTAPLPNDLQNAEDSAQHHDFYGPHECQSKFDDTLGAWIDYFDRPATDTERALLTTLSYTLPDGTLPDDLVTTVSFPSPLVRRRRWLQIENPEQENTPS